MPISLVSATPQAPNVIRAAFSEPFLEDSKLYNKSNYAFRVRFGTQVAIRAKVIEKVSAQSIDIVLMDSMLDAGKYELSVFNVTAADGIAIQENTYTAIFVGVGDATKCFSIRKRVPSWWDTKFGSTLHALLCATGDKNDDLAGESVTSEINQLALSLSLRTATGSDLSIIGQNYGVTRPPFLLFNDETFRQMIPILSTKRKAALKIFYEVLTILLGDRTTSGWKFFEVEHNRFVIEIPATSFYGLGAGTLASATYLHKDATEHDVDTYPGDYFLADASKSGVDVGDNIILLFQVTAIGEIVDLIKAAGIEYEVVIT